MHTTKLQKIDEADDGTKNNGHNAIWITLRIPSNACDRAEHDGPNAGATVACSMWSTLVGMQ